MSDEPVPMLNRPKEGKSETAEQFANNVLGRMNRAHASFVDKSHLATESREQQTERIEKFKEEAITLIEFMTGKKFDRLTGQRIYSESELAARREAEANADKRDTDPPRRMKR
jgi:hypothetical protein